MSRYDKKIVDAYGQEIKVGSLLVTKENTGPNPGRVWLGVVIEHEGGLWFQSANMMVGIHPNDRDYWQVVFVPKTCRLITGTP